MVSLPVLYLFTSAFCEPCMQTREVLAEVKRLVPAVTVLEIDIVREAKKAQESDIRTTPTVIVAGSDGEEVFRAEGVPTINQVLVQVANAAGT